MDKLIRIGTRGSQLALWQANWVRDAIIRSQQAGLSVELVIIKTKGDKILDVPLAKVGGKGLFVKEIEEAISDGRVDLAVHSMKDMPAKVPEGLCIGAVPEREIPNDVLISGKGLRLSELPLGAKVGTSSLRRASQLKKARPDLEIVSLRGNLDTRLKKLEMENLDAIVLAGAGVKRLNFQERITEYLDETIMLPAVGQGALCIEIRKDDPIIGSIVAALDHQETHIVVKGERAFLNRLEGGCQVPVAAHGKIIQECKVGSSLRLEPTQDIFTLTGLVADVDGKRIFRETLSGPAEDSETIGIELADRLLAMGAKEILDALYKTLRVS